MDIYPGIRLTNFTVVMLPRPGGSGDLAVHVELVAGWAPSTEMDAGRYTDIWLGPNKFVIALPFTEVTQIFRSGRREKV